MSNPSGPANDNRRAYWRANICLIAVLLVIWAAVSYGCGILFVEQLNQYRIGKLPLGFWFAQQGSIYVFVLLIFVYAIAMDRLDRRYGVAE
jgi:putative solute:sodium symporter small subunit